jgi:hypothetical protein
MVKMRDPRVISRVAKRPTPYSRSRTMNESPLELGEFAVEFEFDAGADGEVAEERDAVTGTGRGP